MHLKRDHFSSAHCFGPFYCSKTDINIFVLQECVFVQKINLLQISTTSNFWFNNRLQYLPNEHQDQNNAKILIQKRYHWVVSLISNKEQKQKFQALTIEPHNIPYV